MKTSEYIAYGWQTALAGDILKNNARYANQAPATKESQRWAREMVNLLYPIREDRDISSRELESKLVSMKFWLRDLLKPMEEILDRPPEEIVKDFFEEVGNIYEILNQDARFFENCDPASESLEEVILSYPGFYALVIYRMANILYKMKVPFLPRVISEYAHTKTGIDIHPGAEIGKNCFIDHGTGIVIGETAIIGDHVKIYQGVTLGALYVEKSMADTKRHPTIEDNVILYSGCTILGGDTVVGKDTIIGGNVWLTKSVGPGRIVYHENKTKIRDKEEKSHPLNFII